MFTTVVGVWNLFCSIDDQTERKKPNQLGRLAHGRIHLHGDEPSAVPLAWDELRKLAL